MHMYGENNQRLKLSLVKKSPLHQPLHCDHAFELTLIVHSCFYVASLGATSTCNTYTSQIAMLFTQWPGSRIAASLNEDAYSLIAIVLNKIRT